MYIPKEKEVDRIGTLTDTELNQAKILVEVKKERDRQNQMWGEQNYEIFDKGDIDHYSSMATNRKKLNEVKVRNNLLFWSDVLLEEVYESLCEPNPFKCREELIQVAAVAVAMIESLDRNKK